MGRRLTAEFVGTFWLVLGGCGTAVLAGEWVGALGVSLAFGLTVLTGAYVLGHISGGHFNPAVTVGMVVAGKMEKLEEAGQYIVAQVVGALAACGVLAVIANGLDGFSIRDSGFAANGFADNSPDEYSALAGFVSEFVLTAVFVMIILGVIRASAPLAGAVTAPIAIGLSLTLIHLISIPVTNTSVNPARSTGPAIFVGDWALEQLWMFWVAPIAGAAAGALLHRYLLSDEAEPEGRHDDQEPAPAAS